MSDEKIENNSENVVYTCPRCGGKGFVEYDTTYQLVNTNTMTVMVDQSKVITADCSRCDGVGFLVK